LARIGSDRSTGERSLTKLHRVADDAVEDVVVADDAQFVQHVAREIGPAVVEGRQQTEDPEIAVELHPDHVDDLDEIVQTLHRVVLGLDGDDDVVGGNQAVDRQEPEVRRAIDQDVVVRVDVVFQRVTQDLLTPERSEQLTLRAGEIDVGGCDIDAGGLGGADDVGERRAAIGQDVRHRALNRIEIDAESGGQVGLRVHVHAENSKSLFFERTGEIDRRRRLANSALLIGDRDHVGHRASPRNCCGIGTPPNDGIAGEGSMLPQRVCG
jgi:hypothetical protein